MKKLIATGNGYWLYQTGFTTVYEGTGLETTFASGYAEDANGNQTEIRNIMSALDRDGWTIIDTPDLPTEKAREKRFGSRSEAGRYAAQVRWGNRQQEQGGGRTIASNGVPLEPTWDVNEAILTGRPYAPFLEENYPPEVLKSIDDIAMVIEGYRGKAGDGAAEKYFASHLDPANYSPEVLEMLGAPKSSLFGDSKLDLQAGDLSPNNYYKSLLSGDVGDLAAKMAFEAARKQIARKLIYSYGDEDAKQVAETFRASPNKQLTINVGELTLKKIDETGMVLNQFGTASSGGYLNTKVRATHEAISYGVHPATKPDARPIYGTFHPIGVRHASADGTGQYGSVQLVLKPQVHDRATFTMHDSLGMVRHASPVNGKITMGQEFPSMRQGKDALANPVNRVKRMNRGLSAEYAETQIHGGGVKISDIGSIVWSRGSKSTRKTPPPEVQAFAKKHGLKVIVAEFAKSGEPWGVMNLDGAPVQKSFDAIVQELTDVILKAKSFNGDRSAAGAYAARVRWGNSTKQTPSLPDGWKVESERQSNSGYTTYILEGPEDEGGTLSALVRAGEDGVSVELNRIGGENHRKIGEITTSALPEMGHDNLPPNTFAVDFVGVHADDRRKGYATLMLEIARAKSYKGYDIQHSTLLTDDGAEWASATKSFDDVEKGRPRKFNSRSEAGRYAAQMRWGSRTGDGPKPLAPHMQAMKDEADAIRAELAEIVTNMDMENLQRSSPKTRKATWTDDKGAIQIDTTSEELTPSPRLCDAHDRVVALGKKVNDEAFARTKQKKADGDERPMNEIHAESMQQVVAELTPVGGTIKIGAIRQGTDSEQATWNSAFQAVGSVLPTSWVNASGDHPLDVEIDMKHLSPFFRPSPERRGYKTDVDLIGVGPPDTMSKNFKSASLTQLSAHEYTHMVEARIPAVKALSIAFMTHRTTGFSLGSELPPLRQRLTTTSREGRIRMGNAGFSAEGNKDSFSSLYSGRRYDYAEKYHPRAAYAKTPNNDRKHASALEVLTTGVEQIFDGNRGAFDDDHMGFVLGTLVST